MKVLSIFLLFDIILPAEIFRPSVSFMTLMPLFPPQTGDTIIQLYNNFITDFETKINLLKLAHFAVIASRQYPDKDAAITFLEGVITKLRETRESRINEPILYVKMQIAAINLEKGNQKECKNLVEEGKTTLDSMTDVGPTVHASFYWISSQYHKARQEFAEFYKNALLYLAYTTVESLSESFKLVCFIIYIVDHKKNHSVVKLSCDLLTMLYHVRTWCLIFLSRLCWVITFTTLGNC